MIKVMTLLVAISAGWGVISYRIMLDQSSKLRHMKAENRQLEALSVSQKRALDDERDRYQRLDNLMVSQAERYADNKQELKARYAAIDGYTGDTCLDAAVPAGLAVIMRTPAGEPVPAHTPPAAAGVSAARNAPPTTGAPSYVAGGESTH